MHMIMNMNLRYVYKYHKSLIIHLKFMYQFVYFTLLIASKCAKWFLYVHFSSHLSKFDLDIQNQEKQYSERLGTV